MKKQNTKPSEEKQENTNLLRPMTGYNQHASPPASLLGLLSEEKVDGFAAFLKFSHSSF